MMMIIIIMRVIISVIVYVRFSLFASRKLSRYRWPSDLNLSLRPVASRFAGSHRVSFLKRRQTRTGRGSYLMYVVSVKHRVSSDLCATLFMVSNGQ